MSTVFDDDVLVRGTLRATTNALSAGCVTDAAVAAAAGLAATKLEHQHAVTYYQADGADVAAAIVPIYTVRGTTATIVAIEVVCIDAPSGGNEGFTVDLKVADEGTPTPASVLTAVITYGAAGAQADCAVLAGTISSASLVQADTLLVVVAALGATGAKGQGLIVTVTVREDAD